MDNFKEDYEFLLKTTIEKYEMVFDCKYDPGTTPTETTQKLSWTAIKQLKAVIEIGVDVIEFIETEGGDGLSDNTNES